MHFSVACIKFARENLTGLNNLKRIVVHSLDLFFFTMSIRNAIFFNNFQFSPAGNWYSDESEMYLKYQRGKSRTPDFITYFVMVFGNWKYFIQFSWNRLLLNHCLNAYDFHTSYNWSPDQSLLRAILKCEWKYFWFPNSFDCTIDTTMSTTVFTICCLNNEYR